MTLQDASLSNAGESGVYVTKPDEIAVGSTHLGEFRVGAKRLTFVTGTPRSDLRQNSAHASFDAIRRSSRLVGIK